MIHLCLYYTHMMDTIHTVKTVSELFDCHDHDSTTGVTNTLDKDIYCYSNSVTDFKFFRVVVQQYASPEQSVYSTSKRLLPDHRHLAEEESGSYTFIQVFVHTQSHSVLPYQMWSYELKICFRPQFCELPPPPPSILSFHFIVLQYLIHQVAYYIYL